MAESIDCLVIGAGVIGLAVTRKLAMAGREVLLLEEQPTIGTETSSRNSEVIHAGIYYPPKSLKAKLCVQGKEMLYKYCKDRNIPHSKIGKIIVANSSDEENLLKNYVDRAAENGVRDLVWLQDKQIRQMEPALEFNSAVFSPSTGIIDSHSLMLSFQGDAENHGALMAFNSPLITGHVKQNGFNVDIGGTEPMELHCNHLINCAGLKATLIAQKIHGVPSNKIPTAFFGKAHYYTLSRKSPFNHLIYPVNKSTTSLGVHVTLDLAGQARFGPDLTWISGVDYEFDNSREPMFYEAIRKYFPDLRDGELQPGYTGVRPKISGPNAPAADFEIQDSRHHGVPGLINLFGIESPGLTASLAIGDFVKNMIAN
ncbi:MAG: FAD-dependent oxidoreductase [Proteobacteria bacterium]|nr:FAD-dependent oxidoreductase [Pseudomonadota bacterium]